MTEVNGTDTRPIKIIDEYRFFLRYLALLSKILANSLTIKEEDLLNKPKSLLELISKIIKKADRYPFQKKTNTYKCIMDYNR